MDANSPPSDDYDFLTTTEAATILRVSKATIWRLIDSGRMKAYRVRRSWRISRADLEDFIKVGLHDPDNDPTTAYGTRHS
ncbi:helix-turn-helix domain-containing protein [Candidatus Saccharibacteria bacterium]|nr:helix-turn-helix domain-containing protein [Candidatus Saccharibacteria bacterium]